MKRPLYQVIAQTLQAYQNCVASGNTDWEDRHDQLLEAIERDLLPSGSGVDSGTTIDRVWSKPDRLILQTSFHHMTDHGYYDGWTEHRVAITPSLAHGIEVKIGGRDRNDIKNYLGDLLDETLRQDVSDWLENRRMEVQSG